VFLLALVARTLYAAAIYTPDFLAYQSGDYALYQIGAQHFLQHGDFNNSLFLVRPPLFPLWVAALGNQALPVLVSDIVLGAFIAPLGMAFARQLVDDRRVAVGVGVLLALDPTGIQFSAFLGPEPLANVTLLIGMIALLQAMRRGEIGAAVFAAAMLMASAYTRPSTYLFWIPLAIWWVLARRHWRAVSAFVAISVIGVALWTLHNARTFDTPSFSTVAPYTMVYYRAASVERIATNQPIEDVYISINQRVVDYAGLNIDPVREDTRHGFLAAAPDVQSALNRVALEIFSTHPLITLATFPVGFARMYGLFPETFTPLSITLVAFNAAFTLGALIGAALAIRRRQWMLVWATAIPIAYYTAGTLIVKSAGMDTRERSMLESMLAVLCVVALIAWIDRVRRSPPTSG
jgi:hypothetical protein